MLSDRTRAGLAIVAAGLAMIGALSIATGASAATFTVANTNDAGPGSLRQAILNANAVSGDAFADVIDATGVEGVIDLASQLPSLTGEFEIRGPGAEKLTIRPQGGGGFTVLTATSAAVVEVRGVKIADGGGPSVSAGGVENGGRLTLRRVAIERNTGSFAGGIHSFSLASGDGLVIVDSTISDNTAHGAEGVGGIKSEGGVRIRNSTITGNVATGTLGFGAGGIAAGNIAQTTIESSTIAGNVGSVGTLATAPANIRLAAGASTLVLRSSVVAEPLGNVPNCFRLPPPNPHEIVSEGFNIADDASCEVTHETDWESTDPLLGDLADNGGPTETMLPAPGSPAIDAGFAGELATDQRGLPRPVDLPGVDDVPGGDGADIGAVEVQADPDPPAAPRARVAKVKVNPRNRTAKVRFSASHDTTPESELAFACRLDKRRWRPCRSPRVYRRLKPGGHVVRVRAATPDGTAGPPASARFRVKRAR